MRVIGEYSSVVQTGSDAKTVYTTNDHLGSPRINTDATGQVISRHDYHPFGEEIARTGYGSDTIRKQFTGYERDGETGLDYAVARQYNASLGRFSGPDPALGSMKEGRPQSYNRYSYVENRPTQFVDPFGLYICTASTNECDQFRIALDAARAGLAQIKKDYGADSENYLTAKKALDSYGAHGVDNKVLVKSGILKTPGATGEVDGRRDANGNIVVTFDPSRFSSSAKAMTQSDINSFAGLVGHEGAHVYQFGKSMSIYDREFQGNLTQSLLVEMTAPRGRPSGWDGKSVPGEGSYTIMGGQGTLWNTDWNYAGSIVPINPQSKLDANTSKG